MLRPLTFWLLTGACASVFASDATTTEEPTEESESLAYLNGYTVARVLAERYEGAELEAFLAGMIAAADAAKDHELSEEDASKVIRNLLAWGHRHLAAFEDQEDFDKRSPGCSETRGRACSSSRTWQGRPSSRHMIMGIR